MTEHATEQAPHTAVDADTPGGTRHIVNYSGGVGSWAAAKRVVERYGPAETVLLCADTLSEHDTWLPFVESSATLLGAELVVLTHGLDVWELAFEQGAIPNSRMGFCTRILKRELLDAWRNEHYDPASTVLHYGFDWTEMHRLDRMQTAVAPWKADAPLLWEPMVDKVDAISQLQAAGLDTPEAYLRGMPHNNCLKYGCVKGGMAYWAQLLREFPDAFARSEENEQRFRKQTGKDVSILRERKGGVSAPLPLTEIRRRSEQQPSLFEGDEWGACACF